MTKRQRVFWKEYYKWQNYVAMLKLVKGVDATNEEKFEDLVARMKCHLESITMHLQARNHEMYLTLKSLKPLKKALNVSDSKLLSYEELTKALNDALASDEAELLDEASDSVEKEGAVDD